MATTRKREPRLSDEDVAGVLALIKGSDSVELKLTIPETEHRSTVAALGIDPLDAQIRQVFFFDTPDLALNEQGVVVRARRVQKKGDDSVVKLRPVVPASCRAVCASRPSSASRWTRCPEASSARGRLKGYRRRTSAKPSWAAGGREALLEGAAGVLRRARAEGIGLDDLSVSARSSSSS